MSWIEDALWRASQRILAPGAARIIENHTRRWAAEHPWYGRCLDVGCGPRSRLADAGIDSFGVDVHPGWGITACATQLPFISGAFARVWSFGLLHHLTDALARQALREMARVTEPGGYVVVFDGVLPEDRHKVSSLIRRLDRGAQMRRQGDHEILLSCVGAWRFERITYARTGLEGIWAWTQIVPREGT